MSDSPLRIVPSQKTQSDPPAGETSKQDELTKLRRLLLEPEQGQINNILERLNNPRVRARETSRSLTEAIRLRTAEDESLNEALGPTIVKAFHNSVRKDPKPVADAISPLMGPAIRRYISMMLNSMVQSFDHALKNSLSWQGLKWRIEAARTGKSFAEVVMLHTLLYRVEQVFLIHKSSGVKLAHVSSPLIKSQDADIVSGMMTAIAEAIKNFARDSFESTRDEADESIGTLDLGDRKVWFEAGPRAVLAAVIRGKAPESLRSEFLAPTIEAIHAEMGETLDAFAGDSKPFEPAQPYLESCLQQRTADQTDSANLKTPFYLWLLLGLLIAGLGAWALFAWRDQRRWNEYIEKLRKTPGIVIIEEGKQGGRRFVRGLRDPLAESPEKILREQTRLDPDKIDAKHWEPYQSFDKEFLEKRARQILEPPGNVELKFENGMLIARGLAPIEWINDARKFARAIPGITAFNEKEVVSEEARRIEQVVLRFVVGTTQIIPGQERELKVLMTEVQKLTESAAAAGRIVQIEIVGHTDTEGSESMNERLSADRALRILSMLEVNAIKKDLLAARGAASREPVSGESSETSKQFNRSVSFKVRR